MSKLFYSVPQPYYACPYTSTTVTTLSASFIFVSAVSEVAPDMLDAQWICLLDEWRISPKAEISIPILYSKTEEVPGGD